MPTILINQYDKTTRRVFFAIPKGKSYVYEPNKLVKQAAQKGETCWYYVFNYLRIRYGKKFALEHTERKIEKILSSYRKEVVAIELQQHLIQQTLNILRLNNSDIVAREEYINLISQYLINIPYNTHTVIDNLQQKSFDELQLLIEEQITHAIINNCKQTLLYLGFNPQSLFQTYLQKEISSVSIDTNNLQDKKMIYQNLVYLEAAKAYKFKTADWHPCDPIEKLITELVEKGFFSVNLIIKPWYYAQRYFIPQQFVEEKIYSWDFDNQTNNATKEIDEGHAILIVGAEKTGEEEYIYFLDPNHSSDENYVYQLPYKELCKSIYDIYWNRFPLITDNIKGPFAYHADLNWNDLELKRYSKLLIEDDSNTPGLASAK